MAERRWWRTKGLAHGHTVQNPAGIDIASPGSINDRNFRAVDVAQLPPRPNPLLNRPTLCPSPKCRCADLPGAIPAPERRSQPPAPAGLRRETGRQYLFAQTSHPRPPKQFGLLRIVSSAIPWSAKRLQNAEVVTRLFPRTRKRAKTDGYDVEACRNAGLTAAHSTGGAPARRAKVAPKQGAK